MLPATFKRMGRGRPLLRDKKTILLILALYFDWQSPSKNSYICTAIKRTPAYWLLLCLLMVGWSVEPSLPVLLSHCKAGLQVKPELRFTMRGSHRYSSVHTTINNRQGRRFSCLLYIYTDQACKSAGLLPYSNVVKNKFGVWIRIYSLVLYHSPVHGFYYLQRLVCFSFFVNYVKTNYVTVD